MADFDLTGEIAAARRTFEKETGWIPFLGAQQVRYFDPPGPDQGPIGLFAGLAVMGGARKLFLGAGLIAVNSITTGLTATDSVGTALTLNTDYWLRPQTAPADGEPYRSVEFRMPQYGEPNSIKIDGEWGYAAPSAGLPDDAFRAVLRMAAAQIAPQIELGLNQGTSSYKVSDIEEKFAAGDNSGSITGMATKWADYSERVIRNYQMVGL